MRLAAIRDWLRRHPLLVDTTVAILLVGPPAVVLLTGAGDAPRRQGLPADLVAAVSALVMLAGRRLWPTALLLVGTAVSAGMIIANGDRHPLVAGAGVIVTVTFAVRSDRRRMWLLAGGCTLLLFVLGGLFGDAAWWSQENLGASAWSIAAIAMGDAVRNRRAYIAEVEARARRAEETREEEARRRVAEERLRIARELHDVVAHHIAVINVQAGAATHVLATRPEAVGPALAHIRRASDTVLKELASVVGVLRGSDELDVTTEPTRGLERLSELLDGFAAAGLRVEHRQHGPNRELPAMVDLAAYRIVQEALTNAQKHGNGKASLAVTYAADRIVIDVSNVPGTRGPAGGSGYGLVGMRERAAAAGGRVTAGPGAGGRFDVHAELPVSREMPS